jgi:hypothetical protein
VARRFVAQPPFDGQLQPPEDLNAAGHAQYGREFQISLIGIEPILQALAFQGQIAIVGYSDGKVVPLLIRRLRKFKNLKTINDLAQPEEIVELPVRIVELGPEDLPQARFQRLPAQDTDQKPSDPGLPVQPPIT